MHPLKIQETQEGISAEKYKKQIYNLGGGLQRIQQGQNILECLKNWRLSRQNRADMVSLMLWRKHI